MKHRTVCKTCSHRKAWFLRLAMLSFVVFAIHTDRTFAIEGDVALAEEVGSEFRFDPDAPGSSTDDRSERSGIVGAPSSSWITGGLALVLAIAGGFAWCRRRVAVVSGIESRIQVIERVALSPKQALFRVRVGSREWLLGVGPSGPPTLLSEIERAESRGSTTAHEPKTNATEPHPDTDGSHKQ